MSLALMCAGVFVLAAVDLPTVIVRSDDTTITESCRIVVPPGTTIADRNENGVIQIVASNVVVEFAEGELRGATPGTRPDEYAGCGIRIVGHKNVTIRNARVHGFRCGVWATHADGLVLEGVDASDSWRAHLKSTPTAEDGSDWLGPHKNDDNEWLTQYGAGFYIEDSSGVVVRRCRVRQSQNGLCLDRVNEAKVYDNDFSFLSGWGMALWRASRNVITRNALDFCVRGYSHGVYNRGQDSAGFLVFEQCCENIFAENSATHGGDCFFGFAGREALGEAPPPSPDFSYKRRGCNDNLLIGNDFSYAPAHGIEMTFSFGNRFLGNRLVGNAICGVWGGYSQDTLIGENEIEGNGEMGYGLERGGVNIEHGRSNRIVLNTFRRNRCGVHLWWDPDDEFAKRPWGQANGTASTGNVIAGNSFEGDELVFHFHGQSEVNLGRNELRNVGRETDTEPTVDVVRDEHSAEARTEPRNYPVCGETHPVGGRPHLRGRENIIMTEWGPWDHEAPLIRLVDKGARAHAYDLHKPPAGLDVQLNGRGVTGRLLPAESDEQPKRYVVTAESDGVHPYVLRVTAGEFKAERTGTLVATRWNVAFFTWDVDPRENLEGWRALASGDRACLAVCDHLQFKYAWRGPKDLRLADALTQSGIGGDHFGMIARTKLPLTRGKWQVATTSDDGIRVMIDGRPVIENWTWHGPQRDTGVFELDADRSVEVVVEHFEIDGYAVLELEIAPAE